VLSNPTSDVEVTIVAVVSAAPQIVGKPFLYQLAAPVDTRLVLSKKEMCNISDNFLPDIYFALCKDDGHFYLYNKANEPKDETGKFTLIADAIEIKYEDLLNKPELFSGSYTDLSDKPEIPSIAGLASEEFVTEAISNITFPESYDDTEIRTIIDGKADKEHTHEQYLTEHQDISHLATKAELPSLDGYATETFVKEEINKIELPEDELYKVDFNNPNYAEAKAAYQAGKVLVLVNAAPDVNSYAMMNYVSDNYITFTKFLMSRSETYGAFNTYYLRNDNT
jgi:hypothetical protein